MNVLVTGSSGFIGSATVRALAAAGHQVLALARTPDRLPPLSGVRYLKGDLRDGLDHARAELAHVDAIAHLAAVRKDWALGRDELRAINVTSGPRLLALAPHVSRFLFVSSVAVYGHPVGGPASEEAPFAPSKRYGVSKVDAEAAIRESASEHAVPLTIARPGIVYGPGDTYGMVANMCRLLAHGRFLLVGRGTNRVNLLYIDDLADGLVRALVSERAAGHAFIFAGPEPVAIQDLATTAAGMVGRPLPRIRVPEWSARLGAWLMERLHGLAGIKREPFLTRAKVDLLTREDLYDTAKAQQVLGFAPSIDLAEGLRRHVAWLRAEGELRRS